jgi:FecR protein
MLLVLASILLADLADGGRVTLLQGTIETKGAADPDFKPLKAGDAVEEICLVRTAAKSKALLTLPGGVELRIHEQTELALEGARKIQIKKGRMMLLVPKGPPPFEIRTEHHPMKTEGCTVDISYQPRVPNGAPATAYIMVLDGNVKAFARNFQPVIYPGFVASAYGTQLNTPDSVRNGAMDTEWVHSLLVEQGKQTEETQNRAIELLSILSKQAQDDPAEAALRSLGELAAPEIARWLSRSFLETQVARRKAAARALADAATLKSAPLLTGLLTHQEAQVRVIMADGLTRLAGKDLGYNEAYWKGDKLEAGQRAWDEWVKQNAK